MSKHVTRAPRSAARRQAVSPVPEATSRTCVPLRMWHCRANSVLRAKTSRVQHFDPQVFVFDQPFNRYLVAGSLCHVPSASFASF